MGRHGQMLLGVFVGGRGRRMGGVAKGLLPAPDGSGSIVSRWHGLAEELGLSVVWVGDAAAYGKHAEERTVLADEPPGIGPLGGLQALLDHAGERTTVAVACDMPYVSAELLGRLTSEVAPGAVLAPRDPETGKWQPLFARYDPLQVRPMLAECIRRGERSFQALFRCLGHGHEVSELRLSARQHSELRDWDRPTDVVADTVAWQGR